jgi:hypothetical protein
MYFTVAPVVGARPGRRPAWRRTGHRRIDTAQEILDGDFLDRDAPRERGGK